LPDRVTLLLKTTLGRETEIVTDCGDAAVPALATSSVADRAARTMIVLRIGKPLSSDRFGVRNLTQVVPSDSQNSRLAWVKTL
jgi:hypothetical protein